MLFGEGVKLSHQEPVDKKLYDASKELIFNSYKSNSPFRSGALVRHYKDRFKEKHPDIEPFKESRPKKLDRFFQEKWVDVVPLIAPKSEGLYKVFRPTNRVITKSKKGNFKTGLLVKELSKDELKHLIKERQQRELGMPIAKNLKNYLIDKGIRKGEGEPDYEDLDWGSFTKQFKNRKQRDIKTLEDYAKYIEEHSDNFAPKTLKRARFYLNVILKRGGMIVRSFSERPENTNHQSRFAE